MLPVIKLSAAVRPRRCSLRLKSNPVSCLDREDGVSLMLSPAKPDHMGPGATGITNNKQRKRHNRNEEKKKLVPQKSST